jgi:hypothetical protein
MLPALAAGLRARPCRRAGQRIRPIEAKALRKLTWGDFQGARPVEDVIADATRMLRDWSLQVTHPRYFGLFNPSVHLSSVAADALVAAFNPQLAAWSHAPAANEIERHTLSFFARCLGFDSASSACAFTTGGSEPRSAAEGRLAAGGKRVVRAA